MLGVVLGVLGLARLGGQKPSATASPPDQPLRQAPPDADIDPWLDPMIEPWADEPPARKRPRND